MIIIDIMEDLVLIDLMEDTMIIDLMEDIMIIDSMEDMLYDSIEIEFSDQIHSEAEVLLEIEGFSEDYLLEEIILIPKSNKLEETDSNIQKLQQEMTKK